MGKNKLGWVPGASFFFAPQRPRNARQTPQELDF